MSSNLQILTGRVIAQDGPIADVVVSNGMDVTLTGSDGCYSLPRRDDTRFVSVTKPTGYAVQGPFYHDVRQALPDACIDFKLHTCDEPVPFSFGVIGDLHVADPFPAGARVDMATINKAVHWASEDTKAHDGAFLVSVGDVTHKARENEFKLLTGLINDLSLPFYPLIGNHDTSKSTPENYADNYQTAMGPLCYSFEYGGLHLSMYDLHWLADRHCYRPWLDNDLAVVPKGMPCVVVIHDGSMPSDFYDSLPANRVIAVLGGHWHTSRCFRHNGRRHYEVNPIVPCGSMDGSPTCYQRMTFDGRQLTSSIRVYVEDQSLRRATFCALDEPVNRFSDQSVIAQMQPGADWATLHGPQNTRATDDVVTWPPRLAWRSACPGGALLQSPIVAAGKVFMPSQDEEKPCGYLTAFDLFTGDECWTVQRDAPIRFSAMHHNGVVVCATLTGEVLACNGDDGRILWTHQLGDPTVRHVYQAPSVYRDGVLIGTAAHFACLDIKTGQPRWVRQDLAGEWAASYGTAAVDEDRLYVGFGGQPHQMWCLDAQSGQTIWDIPGRKRLGDGCSGAPVVGQVMGGACKMVFYHRRGAVVVGAFCNSGQINWTYHFDGSYSYGSPAFKAFRADADRGQTLSGEFLFTPRSPGSLACLKAREGQLQWQWQAPRGPLPIGDNGQALISSPLVAGSFVHIACMDGTVRTIDAGGGREIGAVSLSAPSLSSPVATGNVLVAADCSAAVSVFVGSQD